MKLKHGSCIVLLLFSCNNAAQKKDIGTELHAVTASDTNTLLVKTKHEVHWKGFMEHKIPIWIHYQIDDDLIVGEITYLNTSTKAPIKLLGTIDANHAYRLLAFDLEGNITGILIGTPHQKQFEGIWYAPEGNKDRKISLTPIDMIEHSETTLFNANNISGSYPYQYGADGYMGNLSIHKINDTQVILEIFSLTNAARGPNIAQVDRDTATLVGHTIQYALPESEDCTIQIKCYNGFAYIRYTNGYCAGSFGLNATIAGIFIKIKE